MQGGLDAPVVHVAECCDFVLRSHDLLLIDVHGRCSPAHPSEFLSASPTHIPRPPDDPCSPRLQIVKSLPSAPYSPRSG